MLATFGYKASTRRNGRTYKRLPSYTANYSKIQAIWDRNRNGSFRQEFKQYLKMDEYETSHPPNSKSGGKRNIYTSPKDRTTGCAVTHTKIEIEHKYIELTHKHVIEPNIIKSLRRGTRRTHYRQK